MTKIIQDPDLLILNECSNEQLKSLVDILVFDKDGKKRIAESLSTTKHFIEHYPKFLKVLVPDIINEIQRFGGNTIINTFRGHGVAYREILEDVCDKLKVNYNKKLSTPLLEGELLRKVAVTVVEKMTDEDVKQFDANLDKKRFIDAIMSNNGPAMLAIIAIVISQITKQTAEKGTIVVLGNILSTKATTLVVPVLNVLSVAWTIFDIAGAAYRVTVPFTITLAFIRRQLSGQNEELKEILV